MEKILLFTNCPGPNFSLDPWTKEGEETSLGKKFGLNLLTQKFIDPSRQAAEEYAFVRKAPGVTIVPKLKNGSFVITRTFKHGSNQIVWEFPAGSKPKGVTSANQAQVELAEETGLTAGEIISLGRACVAPRKFDTYEELFIALNCTLGTPKPEPGEILEVWEVSLPELWEIFMMRDGSFSGFSEMAFMRAHYYKLA